MAESWNYSEPLEKFTLQLSTVNEVFAPDPAPELARILRTVAARIERGEDISMFQTILDSNGNDVGRFAHKPASYR